MSDNLSLNPDKCYGKFYEPYSELIPVGTKFTGCDCIVESKDDFNHYVIVELCQIHEFRLKNGYNISLGTEPACGVPNDPNPTPKDNILVKHAREDNSDNEFY